MASRRAIQVCKLAGHFRQFIQGGVLCDITNIARLANIDSSNTNRGEGTIAIKLKRTYQMRRCPVRSVGEGRHIASPRKLVDGHTGIWKTKGLCFNLTLHTIHLNAAVNVRRWMVCRSCAWSCDAWTNTGRSGWLPLAHRVSMQNFKQRFARRHHSTCCRGPS